MRRRHTRTAAGLTALAAGVLAAFALRPSSSTTTAVAARNPAIEVRTVVIRRTIHIVRHQHAGGTAGPAAGRAGGHRAVSVSTSSSKSHGGGSTLGTGPVATRTSPSHSAPSSGSGAAGGPVTTRTSKTAGSPSGGLSGKPVSTRTSGSAGHGGSDDGGDGNSGRDN